MTEQELESMLDPVISQAANSLTEMEKVVAAAENKLAVLDRLAEILSVQAAVSDPEQLDARLSAFIDSQLDPINRILDEAEQSIGPVTFDVVWEDVAEEEATDALATLSASVSEHVETVSVLAEAVTSDVIETVNYGSGKLDELLDQGGDAVTETGNTSEALIGLMQQTIPDFGSLVSTLVGVEFGSRLDDLANQAEQVLDVMESLVDQAGASIIDKVAQLQDVLETINEIVQPLEPAFDAFEVLR